MINLLKLCMNTSSIIMVPSAIICCI